METAYTHLQAYELERI